MGPVSGVCLSLTHFSFCGVGVKPSGLRHASIALSTTERHLRPEFLVSITRLLEPVSPAFPRRKDGTPSPEGLTSHQT